MYVSGNALLSNKPKKKSISPLIRFLRCVLAFPGLKNVGLFFPYLLLDGAVFYVFLSIKLNPLTWFAERKKNKVAQTYKSLVKKQLRNSWRRYGRYLFFLKLCLAQQLKKKSS